MNRVMPSEGVKENLLLLVFFCALYLIFYYVSKPLGYVNTHDLGITLFFVPAGIRTIAALVGRAWGMLGVSLAIAWVISDLWGGQSPAFYLMYGLIGGYSTFIGIAACQRWMGIHSNLDNLSFYHLPVLDLVATVLHVVLINLFVLQMGLIHHHELMHRLLAQTLGNFLGGMGVMLSLTLILYLRRRYSFN